MPVNPLNVGSKLHSFLEAFFSILNTDPKVGICVQINSKNYMPIKEQKEANE